MSDPPSAVLLERYATDGEEPAATELFQRYVARLTALARSRMSRTLAARVDAEDVVQSAYRSFFLLARSGRIKLHESGDLWKLLAQITLRKVYHTVRRHRAECRDVAREYRDTEEVPGIPDSEPTPAETAALLDQLRSSLAPLNFVQRRMIEHRLEGHEVEDIASQVGRSARTVRRVLASFGAELERRLVEKPRTKETGLIPFEDIVLLRQIGQGGMGKVYRATWRNHPGPVAVKLLRKPLRNHETTEARFLAEAALLARLRHPGLVALHGIGHFPDGSHFLILDLVDGVDLSRVPPPSRVEALRWVAEAAEAIHQAHTTGVIHCDLKPSNLLLGSDGHIRVTDFGLGRVLGDSGTSLGGTEGFLAPEQCDPQRTVTPQTDVFGLGAVLRALHPTPAPAIDEICRRCLAQDPQQRYPSAAALAATLRGLLTGDPIALTRG